MNNADRFSQLATQSPGVPLAEQPTQNLPEITPPGTATPVGPQTLRVPVSSAAMPRLNVPGYEILSELGRGGMGVVYKARQVSLKRLVALKMIRGGVLAEAEVFARFRAEAEAVARLQHPNIVQVYETGTHDGAPFFSLEYVDGGSLAQRLDGTPLPPRDAAALAEALARAVHYAHQHGIVHRDLKPANILIGGGSQAPGAREIAAGPSSQVPGAWYLAPKITDFGLAKQLDGDAGQTQSGAVMGTPSYMAPEQATGRVHEVGPLADVYALGAVLYDLLTGRPPFQGTTLLDTLEQVKGREPVPPTQLQPKLPRDLETICLKCLQKEPAQRYGSALELADDLRRFLDDEPIRARPVGQSERLWRWCRRNPRTAALLTALAATLTGGLVAVTVLWLRSEGFRRQAEDNLTEARRQRDLAEEGFGQARKAVDQFTTTISEAELLNQPGAQPLRKTLLKQARDYYEVFVRKRGDDPSLQVELGWALLRLGSLTGEMESESAALEHYRRALVLLEVLCQEQPDDADAQRALAACLGYVGLALSRDDKDTEAGPLFEREAALYEKLVARDPHNSDHQQSLAISYNHLGFYYRDSDRDAESEKVLLKGKAIWEKLIDAAPTHRGHRVYYGWCLSHLGHLASQRNRRDDALTFYRKALEVRRSLAHEQPDNPDYQTNLADAYQALAMTFGEHQPSEAEAAFREALAVRERLTRANPETAKYAVLFAGECCNYGSHLEDTKPDDALPWFARAAALLDEVLTRQPANGRARMFLRNAHWGRARTLSQLERWDEAFRHWDRAIDLDTDRRVLSLRIDRARCLAARGDHVCAALDAEAFLARYRPDADDSYNLACVFGLAAKAAVGDSERHAAYVARTLALLHQAAAAGYFRKPENLKAMDDDEDLTQVRSEQGYKLLIKELNQPK